MTMHPHITPNTSHTVDLLAFAGFQLLDITGPMQVFASANRALAQQGSPSFYRLRLVARENPVTAWAGLSILSAPLPPAGEACGTLLVAGGGAVLDAVKDGALVAWLAQRAKVAGRIASICTGAFLVGAAGLLDGRRVVTHWDSCALLAHNYPSARVDPDPIFIEDGALWTSAGVTAGIDLALALVERDLGRAVALTVARDLVVFLKRPGGQSQYSATLALQHGEERFQALHEWMRDNLLADLSIPALSARCGMSERSFQRHYRKSTGLPPAQAVERLRVEQARFLLAETALPLKSVAARCGFGSEETMRRGFARQLSTTPQAYRERFAAHSMQSHATGKTFQAHA